MVYEVLIALASLYAITAEHIARITRDIYVFADVWGTYTYLSNTLVAFALLTSTFALWKRKDWRWVDYLRGGATLAIIVTGAVFALLVGTSNPVFAVNNDIMHNVVPVAVVLAWFLHPPTRPLRFSRTCWLWLVFPVTYAVFAITHGQITGDYYYNFLSIDNRGWSDVLSTISQLAAAAVVVTWLLSWLQPRLQPQIATHFKAVWARQPAA
ncbi:MAG TPA: Pr6Pr family membrane protein [Candidatus Saccharimonadales bacterium]|nr:Pr6Pr family membrane protein [Candidatus Saccharimonadales bacterium]